MNDLLGQYVCMSKIANLVDLWTMEALNPKGMGFNI